MIYGQKISFRPHLFIPIRYLIAFLVILLWLPSTLQAEDCKQARQIYGKARDTSDYSRKLTLYREAIRLCPSYAEAHNNLADALEYFAQYDQAITEYQKAVTLKPDLAASYFGLGDVYLKIGLYQRSIGYYQKGLLLCPDDPKTLKNLQLARKGVFEAKEGEVVPFEQILIELSRCGFSTMGPGGVRVTINRVRFRNILFDFGSAIIKKDSYRQLDEISKAICSKELHGGNFTIEGHTDSIGTETYNRKLSLMRAEAVRDYLLRKFDINGERLKILGHGEMRPIATNDTKEGGKKNRRVEIVKETIP